MARVADVRLGHHVVAHQPIRDPHVELVGKVAVRGELVGAEAVGVEARLGRLAPEDMSSWQRVYGREQGPCCENKGSDLSVRPRHVVREVVERAELEILVVGRDLLLALPAGVGPTGVERGLVRGGDADAAAVAVFLLLARVACGPQSAKNIRCSMQYAARRAPTRQRRAGHRELRRARRVQRPLHH